MTDISPEVVTFSRRRKGSRAVSVDSAQEEGENEKENIVAKTSTIMLDKKDQISDIDDRKPGKWRRKGRRNRRAVATANYLASIREQFAEIDSFELLAETPSPLQNEKGHGPLAARSLLDPNKKCHIRGDLGEGINGGYDMPPMYLRSSLAASNISSSPLQIRIGGSQSAPIDILQQRSTVKRSSILGRVSIGLQDAMKWMNRQGGLSLSGKKKSVRERSISEANHARQINFNHDSKTPSHRDEKSVDEKYQVERNFAKDESIRIFTIAEEGSCSKDDEADVTRVLQKIQASNADKIEPISLEKSFTDQLKLQDTAAQHTPETRKQSPRTLVEQLLVLCGQCIDVESTMSMEELLGHHVDLDQVKKIGEGTFGEAFKADDIVFKIVPMEGKTLVNGEQQKKADEILAEVAITLTLSGLRNQQDLDGNTFENITYGFVQAFGVGVCRGKYAEILQQEWHRWDDINGSENEPLDIFDQDQLYVVFVVAHGGTDLEHFEIQSFDEIRSILMQVTLNLAVAEESCCFEHRDLHWGNILINRDGTNEVTYRLRGVDIKVQTAGIRVTLIDFTLSRLVTQDGDVAYCDLSLDPELFKGPKGDPQAETYRRMKKATKDHWREYAPVTNALWLHYLGEILSSHKLPKVCTRDDKMKIRSFRKDASSATCANDLVWNDIFSGLWSC